MSESRGAQDGEGFDARGFLRDVTERPGVYRMYDAAGEILYVGKARNLKRRLASYFRSQQPSPKTRALVAQIADVEVTVTRTEAEALLLESNLIKAHRPRYNVLLRDDKSYPWIYVSVGESFPRVAYHRGARRKPGRYFGPYASAVSVRETLNLLEKVFKVRQCEDSVFRNRSRPCLQYQIGRCKAPCVGYVREDEYRQDVEDTVAFLAGQSRTLIDRLVARMETAAASLDFEQAATLRDQIGMLRAVSEQQHVTGVSGDADVVALVSEGGLACISVTTIRDGRHLGTRPYFPELPEPMPPGEILAAFLGQYYGERDAPERILVNEDVEDVDWLGQALAERSDRRVRISRPQRGKGGHWLESTVENARIALASRLASRGNQQARWAALESWLGGEPLRRIECFDISHSHGEATVASCVVFGPEGAERSQYRRYNIRDVAPGDDYAAMHQALTRRFGRAVREAGVLPDLLLIDGGTGQVRQALDVLATLALDSVRVVGVAKGPARKAGEERLILTDGRGEMRLDPHSPALHLVQQVRDEAHRFAITGHRARRGKARSESNLQQIPGVGPRRRQALLKHFGGLQALKRAGVDELATVPGVSRALAERIHAWFHEGLES
ncbi:MAG: excinuclease ABC subunit UvrC [Halothiobacillaceae bacterium]